MKKVILLSFILFCFFSAYSQGQPAKQTGSKSKFSTVDIKTAELNKTISNYIKEEYKDYSIQTSSKLLKNGVVFKYKIEVVNGEDKKTLMFTKDYKFIEELEPKANKPDKASPIE
jgi:hypothetical protein